MPVVESLPALVLLLIKCIILGGVVRGNMVNEVNNKHTGLNKKKDRSSSFLHKKKF